MNEFQEFDKTIDNITNEIQDEKLEEEYLREGEQNSQMESILEWETNKSQYWK